MHKLHDIAKQQKIMLEDLESQIKSLESSDLFKENESLKTKLEKLTTEHEILTKKHAALEMQNTHLTDTLYEHTFNEKMRVLDRYEEKLSIFFNNTKTNADNNLTRLESIIKSRINLLATQLNNTFSEINYNLNQRLESFQVEVTQTIEAARKKAAQEKMLTTDESEILAKLRADEISQDQVVALAKTNSLERLVGLNIINALGILLIIIGTIAAGRFVDSFITDTMRMILIFVGGGVLLIAGEVLNRRREWARKVGKYFSKIPEPNVFSLGLSACGIAVLYVGLTFGYFAWGLLSMFVALGICVAITAVTFWLSTHYKSQTLLIIALVGGYMPIFTLTMSFNLALFYGVMVYFLILSLLDLIVSFKMRWTISTYMGMLLSMASTIMIQIYFFNAGDNDIVFLREAIILIIFTFWAFANYTAIPIISAYYNKSRFVSSDVFMIAINTTASCISMYALLLLFGWGDFTGLLALVFAVVYLFASWIVGKKFDDSSRDINAWFFLTGITFVVLIIPMQFGMDWLVFGWLVQGVMLAIYGILKDIKRFKNIGIIIFCLCCITFALLTTVAWSASWYWSVFLFDYISVTVGSLLILVAYVYKNHPVTAVLVYLKSYRYIVYAVLINVWVLSLVLIFRLHNVLIRVAWVLCMDYLMFGFAIVVTLALGFVFPRIRPLVDDSIRFISICFYIGGIIGLVVSNIFGSPITYVIGGGYLLVAGYLWATLLGSALLVLLVGLTIASLYAVLRYFVLHMDMGIAYVPVILSAYGLFVLTKNMITQYNIAFSSMWISFVFAVFALTCIIVGFSKKHMLLRRFGLVLALGAVAKLFLIDLSGLTQGHRIISYFVLGVLLVGISFVYQLFNKRLESLYKKSS